MDSHGQGCAEVRDPKATVNEASFTGRVGCIDRDRPPTSRAEITDAEKGTVDEYLGPVPLR